MEKRSGSIPALSNLTHIFLDMQSNEYPWTERWDTIDEVGNGGQGVVTRLVDKKTGARDAVVKQLGPRWKGNQLAADRMRTEIQSMKKLNSHNAMVPKLINSFLDHPDSEPYFVMEFIEGIRFTEWLDSNAPCDLHTALLVTRAIADTINLCHGEDIGHRDLKPANIILKDGDPATPYVIDFGVSFDSMDSVMATKGGEVFFNEFLILPEGHDQLGGHRDPRSDLTAVAGVFFNCLTGRRPGAPLDQNGHSPQRRHFEQLSAVSNDASTVMRLRSFFDTAFAHNIGERFQKFDDFMAKLAQFDQDAEDTESLAALSREFGKKLLAQNREAQLATLRRPAADLASNVIVILAERVRNEPDLQIEIQTTSFAAPSALIDSVAKAPSLPADIDHANGGSLTAIVLKHQLYEQVALVTVFPMASRMRIHFMVGGWIAGSAGQRNKPLRTVDWVDGGSAEFPFDDRQSSVVLSAVSEAAYSQLKAQIRQLMFNLET